MALCAAVIYTPKVAHCLDGAALQGSEYGNLPDMICNSSLSARMQSVMFGV